MEKLHIDGVPVDSTKARFSDTFDVEEDDDKYLSYDHDVVYVIVAHTSPPSFRQTKKGGLSRINVLKTQEARVLPAGLLQKKVLTELGFEAIPLTLGNDDDPSLGELEGLGVRFLDEPVEEEVPIEAYQDPPGPEEVIPGRVELEDEMKEWIRLTRSLSDELDDDTKDEPEPEPEVKPEPKPEPALPSASGSRVVSRHRGAAETDPMLRRFLDAWEDE